MLIASVIMAWAAGMLIGAAIAWDRAYLKGKAWGYQLGCEKREGDDIMARIRSLL